LRRLERRDGPIFLTECFRAHAEDPGHLGTDSAYAGPTEALGEAGLVAFQPDPLTVYPFQQCEVCVGGIFW